MCYNNYMNEFDNKKKQIRVNINEFELNDNLIYLAKAYNLIEKIFKSEDFSIEEYYKYNK